jgi:DNA invertase Pin-like site-specific DNA recombinase
LITFTVVIATSGNNENLAELAKLRWIEGLSIQELAMHSQIPALRIFCEQNKITEYELFADENQSGTKASLPALVRMMKAVQNGEIDTVVVFAFSRFARSVRHMPKGLEVTRTAKTSTINQDRFEI